ncbi:kinase-like domain-containing protein [Xylaria palmicola]|nr:kinase-like domain-containing protein [Xylaria palmicola]
MARKICADAPDRSTEPPCDSRTDDRAESLEHPKRPQQIYRHHFALEGVENVEDYQLGGLYPVEMSDMLDGRYKVCQKLGSGVSATVWLCYEKNMKKWRAVKINRASRSRDEIPQLKVAKLVEKHGDSLQLLTENSITTPLETFHIEGPNGRHLCIVLPLLGPTVSEWRRLSLGLDADRITKVCYQFTRSLHFLHSNGICHGDFHPQNIHMRLKDDGLDHLDSEDLLELLGLPNRDSVFTIWGELEFGQAFEASSPPTLLKTPVEYAAPEVLYGGVSLGPAADIWSLANTIMELRTGRLIYGDPLWRMESLAGPIPAPFRAAAAEAYYEEEMSRYTTYSKGCAKLRPLSPSEMMVTYPAWGNWCLS